VGSGEKRRLFFAGLQDGIDEVVGRIRERSGAGADVSRERRLRRCSRDFRVGIRFGRGFGLFLLSGFTATVSLCLAGLGDGSVAEAVVVVVDGLEGTKHEAGDVSQDGGASRGNAALGDELVESDKGMTDLLGFLEVAAAVDELQGEIGGV